jgi:hypothetical protein
MPLWYINSKIQAQTVSRNLTFYTFFFDVKGKKKAAYSTIIWSICLHLLRSYATIQRTILFWNSTNWLDVIREANNDSKDYIIYSITPVLIKSKLTENYILHGLFILNNVTLKLWSTEKQF